MIQTKTNKTNIFVNSVFKKTMGFMFLATMGSAFADIADALVLGYKLGESGLATISFVIPIFMFYNVVAIGLASGCAISYAKFLGEGKAKKGIDHFNESMIATIILGVITAVLGVLFLPQILTILGVSEQHTEVYGMTMQYAKILLLSAPIFFIQAMLLAFLRCDDGVKTASVAFIVGSVVDLLFSIILVIGFDAGVLGAIGATIAGLVVTIFICLGYVFKKYTILRFTKVKPNISRLFTSFKIGLASSTQSIWSMIFFVIMNNLFMSWGGTHAVAVFDLTVNISYVALASFIAAGEILRPMVSTFVGERNKDDIKDTLNLSLILSTLMGVVIIVLLWIFTPHICEAFGISVDVANNYGIIAVRTYLICVIMAGINTILIDYFQVVSKEKYSFIIGLFRGVIVIPATVLFAWLFGLEGVWIMYPASELISLVFALILLKKANKQMHSATKNYKSSSYFINSKANDLEVTLENVELFLEEIEIPMKKSLSVIMMIEEICNTILNLGLKGRDGCIQISLIKWDHGDFELHIRDNAPQFDFLSTKDKVITSVDDDDEVLDSLPIILIRKNAKSHFYRHYQGFNTLTIIMEG